MALHLRGNVTVSTSSLDPVTDEETDITVECHVTPGTPDRGPDFGCAGGYPGDPPEVELLSAEDDTGKDWLPAIEADAKWVAEVEEKALEEHEDAADDYPYDTREEARGER
jgi:hypothetical protein